MSAPHHHHGHDHAHDHDHKHGPAQEHHDHTHGASERRLLIALLLTALFMGVEAAAGWYANSLALLADASHMLTDAVSLGLAFAAVRISRRPADARRSYGYDRMQVLAAFLNGVALIVLSLWITVEAALRILHPAPVLAGPMLVVAIAGLAVNLLAFGVLHGGDKDNLNMRGAIAHVISDMLGSAAAIIAALAILLYGWTQADPLLSAVVALLILRNAWQITRQSAHVLLEGAPDGFDVTALELELPRAIAGIRNVHHVHVWMLSPEKPMLTLHACIELHADADALTQQINHYLHKHHKIAHATIQIERGDCAEPHH
jgi:cobalt-zinc-cadmium efflux system protein